MESKIIFGRKAIKNAMRGRDLGVQMNEMPSGRGVGVSLSRTERIQGCWSCVCIGAAKVRKRNSRRVLEVCRSREAE